MKLTPITTKQKEILFYLYKFRFLNTHHFQKLLNHKDPHRIKVWLKDLLDKSYIARNFSRKTIAESTKPAIYYLMPKARQILKTNSKCDMSALNLVYKEKKRTEKFINKCLTLADLYFFFISQKKQNEELHFFTKTELAKYKYFPSDLPSAYIAIKTKLKTKRYFLDVFDEYTRSPEIRYRVRMYLEYVDNGDWEANAKGDPLPAILFILPTERLKKHIYFYTKAKFEKVYEEKFSLFLTTKDRIREGNKNIWEKVSLDV